MEGVVDLALPEELLVVDDAGIETMPCQTGCEGQEGHAPDRRSIVGGVRRCIYTTRRSISLRHVLRSAKVTAVSSCRSSNGLKKRGGGPKGPGPKLRPIPIPRLVDRTRPMISPIRSQTSSSAPRRVLLDGVGQIGDQTRNSQGFATPFGGMAEPRPQRVAMDDRRDD
jgi:hypothetical protein